MKRRPTGERTTPEGEHRPVLLKEVLRALDPQPGQTIVDCTTGWGGHSAEILQRIGPTGRLIGFDFDAENLEKTRERLAAIGHPFTLHHGNFAGIANVLMGEQIEGVDGVLADLGMSSMQLDDSERGFSYVREGPLDMRMDRSKGKTAADVIMTISEADLTEALRDIGDEPEAEKIAKAIVLVRKTTPIVKTTQLSRLVLQTLAQGQRPDDDNGPRSRKDLSPLARMFQTLRILVNRELANLEYLLKMLPTCLKTGGTAAIISFHSGEDRRVKIAFRDGKRAGIYADVARDPIRPTYEEAGSNPRSRSAKLRLAKKA